ncbi:DUF3800 domain-containing protein [Actinopolymorpha pittospori]|uniref:DUF3800 domain-containing protein n=1 Tax=Actinopolymorpha pittospori TaxID=648752 RepID=A0A927MPV7_9ACTN|nr:DUF3800 domain-containing protein [Actinopolymorpha pittospori]MBE1604479.1 hypothetical protein [Actinopolymorpha pittospori]
MVSATGGTVRLHQTPTTVCPDAQPSQAAPRDTDADQPLEIACDESGHEGENLARAVTDVFAHASVGLDTQAATACIQEIRDRIRSPATEYKANHLLRAKHRAVLVWLLGPSGPMLGNARVHLTEKSYFVVARVVDLLLGEAAYQASSGLYQDPRNGAITDALYRDGERVFGADRWQAFLEYSNGLMRTRKPWRVAAPVDPFFHMVDLLRVAGGRHRVGEIMDLLWHTRARAEVFQQNLLENSTTTAPLDPLLPAIVQAVVHWGEGGYDVSIVHDEQSALTRTRIEQIRAVLARPQPHTPRRRSTGRLTGVRLVDSQSDPRVQVADFLAGVARRIASDELNHRSDPELADLLRPYVDASSIWGDDRSWTVLGPASSELERRAT